MDNENKQNPFLQLVSCWLTTKTIDLYQGFTTSTYMRAIFATMMQDRWFPHQSIVTNSDRMSLLNRMEFIT